jgi:large subunit ribosomal protein L16
MLMPKKTKYRKAHRGRLKGRSKGATSVDFGDYGLQALEPVWLTAKQIEAMRVVLTRGLKKAKQTKLVLRVFPDKPISKKPAETRMGKGKGNVETWVAVVKRDRVLCEISGVNEVDARIILKKAAYKLPMKTRFIKKDEPVLAQQVLDNV